MMVDGWKPVVIAEELFTKAAEYYEKHKDSLKLRDGIRSQTAFLNFLIREQLKILDVIPTT